MLRVRAVCVFSTRIKPWSFVRIQPLLLDRTTLRFSPFRLADGSAARRSDQQRRKEHGASVPCSFSFLSVSLHLIAGLSLARLFSILRVSPARVCLGPTRPPSPPIPIPNLDFALAPAGTSPFNPSLV